MYSICLRFVALRRVYCFVGGARRASRVLLRKYLGRERFVSKSEDAVGCLFRFEVRVVYVLEVERRR